jgi:hypothetical protein
MKSIIFWDMTPCSPLSVNRRFGGTYRLHLQGQRNKFSKKRHIPENDLLGQRRENPKSHYSILIPTSPSRVNYLFTIEALDTKPVVVSNNTTKCELA